MGKRRLPFKVLWQKKRVFGLLVMEVTWML